MSHNDRHDSGFLWFFVFFFVLVIAASSSGCTHNEGTPIEDSKPVVIPERTR